VVERVQPIGVTAAMSVSSAPRGLANVAEGTSVLQLVPGEARIQIRRFYCPLSGACGRDGAIDLQVPVAGAATPLRIVTATDATTRRVKTFVF